MGTLVVKRSRWAAVPLNEAFVGSCWAHAARLFELMRTGLVVTYVPELLVDRRGDNDSFADRGVVNRYRIAIEGYHRIAAAFCDAGTTHAYHVRRVVRAEYGPRMFMVARIRCWQDPESESRELLDALARRAYSRRAAPGAAGAGRRTASSRAGCMQGCGLSSGGGPPG